MSSDELKYQFIYFYSYFRIQMEETEEKEFKRKSEEINKLIINMKLNGFLDEYINGILYISYNKIKIKIGNIRTLDDNSAFMNDDLIDFFFKYIDIRNLSLPNYKRCNCVILTSHFYPLLKRDINRVIARVPMKDTIFDKDYIFLPVNFNLHWILLIICFLNNFRKRLYNNNFGADKRKYENVSIVCCDSLHYYKDDIINLVMNYIKGRYIKERSDEIKNENKGNNLIIEKKINEEKLKIQKAMNEEKYKKRSDKLIRIVEADIEQQEDGHSCGLFTNEYLDFFIKEENWLYINRQLNRLKKIFPYNKTPNDRRVDLKKLILKEKK